MSLPTRKFMQCLQFAAEKHRDQRRKNARQTPYINHPINVATIIAVEGEVEDEVVLMAALLHDTVEDTDTTFAEITENFGEDVSAVVCEVTDDKSLEKQERKRLQIEHAATSSHRAKLIKLADKLDNLRDLQKELPTEWTEERRRQYFVWAKKVVDNLRNTNKNLEALLDAIFMEQQIH